VLITDAADLLELALDGARLCQLGRRGVGAAEVAGYNFRASE